jgi:hypothetical protein
LGADFSVKEKDEASPVRGCVAGFPECLHSPICRGLEVFCFSGPALVSQSLTRSAKPAGHLKDQHMKKRLFVSLASAGLSFVLAARGQAISLQEDFSTDPATRGWQVLGDTTLFHWDATHQNMQVTWDSSRPNSYFCLPLGTTLSKDSDFTLTFDLQLSDFLAGINPDKPYPFQIAIALINPAKATQPGFARGTGADSPDLVEFDFFPDPGGAWIFGPSITPVIADSIGTDPSTDWAYGFAGLSLTTGDLYHVVMSYTASNQTLHTAMTDNGEAFGPVSDAQLVPGFQDFQVDHVAICSYSDAVQVPDFYGSILAHGTVDNFVVTMPPPVTIISGGPGSPGWQVAFHSRSDWRYTLERTVNFRSWSAVSLTTSGNGTNLVLQDASAPADKAFYRVHAEQP